MKQMMTAVVVVACVFFAAAVMAVDGGKVLFYGGAGQGKVIFDGRVHASKGMVCGDCHTAIFEMRKKALITMEDHKTGKACFVCHDGTRAFKTCNQCHRK